MTQKKKIYYILAGVLLLSLIIIGTVSGLYGKLRGYFFDSDLPPLHIAVVLRWLAPCPARVPR